MNSRLGTCRLIAARPRPFTGQTPKGRNHSGVSRHLTRCRAHPGEILVILPVLTLAFAAQTPALPAPTGQYAVGTTESVLVDSSRRDSVSRNHFGGRAILVQLWYPAEDAPHAPAPYLIDSGLLPALTSQQYYGLDSTTLSSWKTVDTHATLDAPLRGRGHPLLVLLGGLGVARANYTGFATELVSHGYIVAAVDLPYEGFTAYPRDTVLTAGDDSANSIDDAGVQRQQAAGWAADVSFVLDRLENGLPGIAGQVALGIDWNHVGIFGHSSGGLIAVDAANRDPRIRAAINLDGGPLDPHHQPIANFVREGIRRPTLFLLEKPIYNDADLARRHLTRAQFEARGNGFAEFMDSLTRQARAPLLVARIAGTGHMSFSDGPFVMPTTISQFGGRILDGRRAWEIITTTVQTFFEHVFADPRNLSVVTAQSARYPELVFRKIGDK